MAADLLMDLMVDSFTAAGNARTQAEERVEALLALPLDDEERAMVEHDQWGLTPDAIAEAERIDAMFGGPA